MEFVMDFEKPSISKNVGKFLEDNLKAEKEKESLINVIGGKAILKCDAINLLVTILKALSAVDNLDDEEYTAFVPASDDPEDGEKSEKNPSAEFPTLAQSMAEWSRTEAKGKKPMSKVTEPGQSTSNNVQPLTGDELLHKFENVCYFYRLGKCRFGKECKKEHPKFCQKYVNFGPIRSNTKGCDNKCNNLRVLFMS